MTQKALLQSLIDIHDHPFVLIDDHYRIVAANDAYRRIYGLQSDHELLGKYCFEISHHHQEPCHLHGEECPHRQVFEKRTSCVVWHTHFDPQGRPEKVRIHGHLIDQGNGHYLLGEAVQRQDCQDINTPCIGHMVGQSPQFRVMVKHLEKAAASNLSILLLGESGTGKELAAQYVHEKSTRSLRSFVAVDCTTLTETLFESELFGHERGAFTGCVGRRSGLFEMADGGTLFLDEIGELPLASQAKLLRALESGEFRRVGGRTTLHADVRIIAATNRNLKDMVARGLFRADLYFRLACIIIPLSPLRERRTDIPLLADHFLSGLSRQTGRSWKLKSDALTYLCEQPFPGNIRELRNQLQRASVLAETQWITLDLLNQETGRPTNVIKVTDPPIKNEPHLSMRDLEAHYIRELLRQHNGHRRRVADTMGISERTLYRKLKHYGLNQSL